jgi:hypothetical protein
MMLETIIKLFVMQIAYDTEEEIGPISCFSIEELDCLEIQIKQLEGKTEKLKNPYKSSDLKRYIWVIARLRGWKGYLSERKPSTATFWWVFKNLPQLYKAGCYLKMCPDGGKKLRDFI